jgi:hypothetical protein
MAYGHRRNEYSFGFMPTGQCGKFDIKAGVIVKLQSRYFHTLSIKSNQSQTTQCINPNDPKDP